MNFQNQIDYLQEIPHLDMLEGVTVPDPLQAETLKTQIVFRCGLLTPVYLEPEIMRAAITQFFIREQWNIEHLVNIILAEYSPIENTDKYSEHTETISGESGSTRTKSGTGTETHSGTDARTIANTGSDTETHSGSDVDTREISAYNSAAYQPDNKETIQHGEQIATQYGRGTTDSLQHGEQVARSDSATETVSGTDDKTHSYTEHTHGNIGVTTNQDMINQELELLRHFDVYDWIAAKLEHELFLQIY